MVKDKINSRAPGSINYLTRQPPAGRAAGGGLRIGEMERDAIISHGITNFLKEVTVNKSDKYECYIGNHMGEIAAVNPDKNIYLSPSYDGPINFDGSFSYNLKLGIQEAKSFSFSKVSIPYCLKLLIQECEAIGISLRIITEKTLDDNQFYNNSVYQSKLENKTEKSSSPKQESSSSPTEIGFNIGDRVVIKKGDKKIKRIDEFKSLIGKEVKIKKIGKFKGIVEIEGNDYKISKVDMDKLE